MGITVRPARGPSHRANSPLQGGETLTAPTCATASISTRMRGSSRPVTSIAAAGRTSAKTSPCARPTASQSAASVEVHPRLHDLVEPRPGGLERLPDLAQRLARLGVGVLPDDRAVGRDRGHPRHEDEVAGAGRGAEADDRRVGRGRRDALARHAA